MGDILPAHTHSGDGVSLEKAHRAEQTRSPSQDSSTAAAASRGSPSAASKAKLEKWRRAFPVVSETELKTRRRRPGSQAKEELAPQPAPERAPSSFTSDTATVILRVHRYWAVQDRLMELVRHTLRDGMAVKWGAASAEHVGWTNLFSQAEKAKTVAVPEIRKAHADKGEVGKAASAETLVTQIEDLEEELKKLWRAIVEEALRLIYDRFDWDPHRRQDVNYVISSYWGRYLSRDAWERTIRDITRAKGIIQGNLAQAAWVLITAKLTGGVGSAAIATSVMYAFASPEQYALMRNARGAQKEYPAAQSAAERAKSDRDARLKKLDEAHENGERLMRIRRDQEREAVGALYERRRRPSSEWGSAAETLGKLVGQSSEEFVKRLFLGFNVFVAFGAAAVGEAEAGIALVERLVTRGLGGWNDVYASSAWLQREYWYLQRGHATTEAVARDCLRLMDFILTSFVFPDLGQQLSSSASMKASDFRHVAEVSARAKGGAPHREALDPCAVGVGQSNLLSEHHEVSREDGVRRRSHSSPEL